MAEDCRTEDGVTVGLIDAIVSICRVVRNRDLSSEAANEMLLDLFSDEDFLYLMNAVDKWLDRTGSQE